MGNSGWGLGKQNHIQNKNVFRLKVENKCKDKVLRWGV
jgi:hypothetical protein